MLLFNLFITLFPWSFITITSSCLLPYFPSLSLSLSAPLFSTFRHLLDSDKQGSKYLASHLFSSSRPFSRCPLSLSPPSPAMASLQQQILLSSLALWAAEPFCLKPSLGHTDPQSDAHLEFLLNARLSYERPIEARRRAQIKASTHTVTQQAL